MSLSVFPASTGDDTIASSVDLTRDVPEHTGGLFLAIGQGQLPDIETIGAFAAAHGQTFLSPMSDAFEGLYPSVGNEEFPGRPLSIQIMRNGLTFDLIEISDQRDGYIPTQLRSYDCEWANVAPQVKAMQLRPGKHIQAGANSLPIMRCFMELARDLVQFFESIDAVIWPPASSVIGRRYFDSSISAWLADGNFPPLGLVAVEATPAGHFESYGLVYFIGQELQISTDLMDDPAAPNGLSARLINQLILGGAVTQPQAIVAPNGNRLTLTPSANGRCIEVRPS